MANAEHLEILESGVEKWNKWREENYEIKPDLSRADLRNAHFGGAYLQGVDLSFANLGGAFLSRAYLTKANLRGAKMPVVILQDAELSRTDLRDANLFHAIMSRTVLTNADLRGADLGGADLEGADLRDANLSSTNLQDANLNGANLSRTNLSGANLIGAFLNMATLVESDFTGANLERARIYGISAWDLKKEGIIQKNLVITKYGEPEITVDSLEVAQFIYLMLNNQNIRDIFDTITDKAVLILGAFSDDRKPLLNALKDELRRMNYMPILFDFDGPTNQSTEETVILLSRMAKFVIVDLTDPKCSPYEVAIISERSRVPIQPIILDSQTPFSMLPERGQFLPIHRYSSQSALLQEFSEKVIEPAEKKVKEIRAQAK